MDEIQNLYKARFEKTGLDKRNRVWRILCADYFQRFAPANAAVLDVACGYGEFINNIQARAKHGVAMNPEAASHLDKDVAFRQTPGDDLSHIPSDSLDRVFTSNFLEHLPSKEAGNIVLAEIRRVLKPGGKFMILGPSIRYAYREYWVLGLLRSLSAVISHLYLAEGLVAAGYEPELVVALFLLHTMNNTALTADWLI